MEVWCCHILLWFCLFALSRFMLSASSNLQTEKEDSTEKPAEKSTAAESSGKVEIFLAHVGGGPVLNGNLGEFEGCLREQNDTKPSGSEKRWLKTRSERNPSNYKLKNISVIHLKPQNRFMNMKLYVFIRLNTVPCEFLLV